MLILLLCCVFRQDGNNDNQRLVTAKHRHGQIVFFVTANVQVHRSWAGPDISLAVVRMD